MGLSFFTAQGATSDSSFTAVMNQDKSLLFPRDIFLNGVFYSGNNFSITTNFQMDAGDRNAPPYDTFTHAADSSTTTTLSNNQSARGDKDYNGNHQLDVQNPFPYAIHRQVTLLGSRVTPDRMEGSYIESISVRARTLHRMAGQDQGSISNRLLKNWDSRMLSCERSGR